MSLSSFLENKDVKEKFAHEFPKPEFNLKKKILAPPKTEHYSSVGTAFDYLMRFYLMYLNPNAITKKWVAENSIDLLLLLNQEYNWKLAFEFATKGMEIVRQAKVRLANYLKTGKITTELIKSAFMLGRLDSVYRTPLSREKIEGIYEYIEVVEDGDIKDLNRLISIVNPCLFKAKRVCVLNPTFGEASILVGGADADLIIDNTLIDIKTTKNLVFDRYTFNQLVGYYILFKIGGIDICPHKVKNLERLGVYYSRFGELYTFPIESVIDDNRLPSFIRWFKRRAREEYEYTL